MSSFLNCSRGPTPARPLDAAPARRGSRGPSLPARGAPPPLPRSTPLLHVAGLAVHPYLLAGPHPRSRTLLAARAVEHLAQLRDLGRQIDRMVPDEEPAIVRDVRV